MLQKHKNVGCTFFLLVLFGGFVVWQNLVPTGKFTIEWLPGKHSSFVDKLLPDSRVEKPVTIDGITTQAIIANPVVQFLHPHRSFDRVEAEVWFKNVNAPLVELGGLAEESSQVYDLYPLSVPLLDSLDWSKISFGEQNLYQRNTNYSSVEDFLSNPPDISEVATYHVDSLKNSQLPNKPWNRDPWTFPVALRGSHNIRFLADQGDVFFNFKIIDNNTSVGADEVNVLIFDEFDQVVADLHLEDDDEQGIGLPSKVREKSIRMDLKNAGAYRIELRADLDINFLEIKTNIQYLVLANHIDTSYFDGSFDIFVRAGDINLQTEGAHGVQNIVNNLSEIKITEPYQRFPQSADGLDWQKLSVPKGYLIIDTDGWLAFSPESSFLPEAWRLSPLMEFDLRGINYILTSYQTPKEIDGWQMQKFSFDANVLFLQDGSWKFVISTPFIDKKSGKLIIRKINWTLLRPPFSFSTIWPF